MFIAKVMLDVSNCYSIGSVRNLTEIIFLISICWQFRWIIISYSATVFSYYVNVGENSYQLPDHVSELDHQHLSFMVIIYQKVKGQYECLYWVMQWFYLNWSRTDPEGCRSLKLPDIQTISTCGGRVVNPTHRQASPRRTNNPGAQEDKCIVRRYVLAGARYKIAVLSFSDCTLGSEIQREFINIIL